MGATTTWERWERFDACRNLARHAARHLGSGRGSRESPPYFGVSALPVCRTDSGLARNQCVSNGGARGRHASGFVGPAVALVALLGLSLLLTWWLRRTKFGMGLIAIREDEGKAGTIGINAPPSDVRYLRIAVVAASKRRCVQRERETQSSVRETARRCVSRTKR